MTEMSDREREIRRRLRDDFEHYARKCCFIRQKDSQVAALHLNKAQRYIHAQLEAQLAKTSKVRALILKGRQQGASTYTEARFYWKVTHRHGVRAFILTHEDAATTNLFEMTDRYHKLCPELLRPHTGASNAKELYFDKLDSGYKVGTAGSKAVGRSSTVQYFHGSEVGYWPNAETHFAGVLQAVPNGPNTEIILESTANGAGGKFYELWQEASAGLGDFIPVFVPWYWQDEYVACATGLEMTDAEKDLVAAYGLTPEQIAWRRGKVHELGQSLCDQEYPNTAEEAFILSGRCVFDAIHLTRMKAGIIHPISRHVITNGVLREHSDGELRVWEHPKAGVRYAIGADTSEGIPPKKEGQKAGDFSVADILEVPSGKQVAQWHGHIDPDLFGSVLVALGNHYNHARVAIERNNHGHTTIASVLRAEYDNIFVQRSEINDSAKGVDAKYGFTTNAKTKDQIIDALVADVRDGTHGICCEDTLREMRTFVIDERAKCGAASGCYDDRVMSRAIAGAAVRQYARELSSDTSGPRVPRKTNPAIYG
jgi:hypothetical protein